MYWRRGRCLAYGNTSYSAFADAIKAQCEIFDDDDAEVAAKKADAAVRELFGDEQVAPQIRTLVGAGEARGVSREDLFEAWRRFLERMAARYPLALVLDDIHWADAGLLDLIEHIADWAQGPIIVLAPARAELFETRPTWGGGKRNAASISLDPLSEAEGEEMLDDLLPGEIAPELRHTIVERSEGNPLYVEEIVRKLIDDGVLRATEASRWEVARQRRGRRAPAFDPGADRRTLGRPSRGREGRRCKTRPSSDACSGSAPSPSSPAGASARCATRSAASA